MLENRYFFGIILKLTVFSAHVMESSNSANLPPAPSHGVRSSKSLRPAASHGQRPKSDLPVYANYASNKLTVGAGVAIFHVATSRVVVCYHTREKHWFLPKGRRDANEDTGAGAEREGYEESGYRNRLLPIPLTHRQPIGNASGNSSSAVHFVTEPVWTQLVPLTATSQYMLFWYIAETLPPDLETALNVKTDAGPMWQDQPAYQYPVKYPFELTLAARQALEPEGYEPVRHPNTGVDDEEALYESKLLPIEKALELLRGTIQEDVIRTGWSAIRQRFDIEASQSQTG
ncbi:MAG: hypothetical protein M4579_007342 [Chaenotheca gracillima]|nr:MAG: hypothetical protein M4579_007342 [Chaenotheca gracillima]